MKKVFAVAAGLMLIMSSVLCAAAKEGKEEGKAGGKKVAKESKEEGDSKKVVKGDKMDLIKFDKGEQLSEGAPPKEANTFRTALVKEHAAKGKMYSCKLDLKKGGTGMGIFVHPGGILIGKRGNWKDYDNLVIKYYLEGDKPFSSGVIFADAESYGENWENWKYPNYCDKTFLFKPGENTMNVDVTGLVCNGGRDLDLSKMRSISLSSAPRPEEVTIYFQEIYVEKE